MNPEDRKEIEQLLAAQRRLRIEMERLENDLMRFRDRLGKRSDPMPVAPEPKSPPILEPIAKAEPPPLPEKPNPPVPPDAKQPPREEWEVALDQMRETREGARDTRKEPTEKERAKAEPVAPPSAPERGGLEMQLGTVWLARIGIVILVTGLVFLGNYAWHNWVHSMGPGGKLAMLYAAGAVLCGLGARFHRRDASLKTYSQVLLAGGGATIYFATYAAHFVPRLKVIESPIIGGTLLLLIGGAMLIWADRKRLQPAALLAIVLSYYTAAINPVGDFTLFSNALLTVAGITLLIRHQWTMLSWASLAGTYLSFWFWSEYRQHSVVGLRAADSWHVAVTFLSVYWALFTAAVFFTRPKSFTPSAKVAFLTLNNGLFVWLCAMQLLPLHQGRFWMFPTLVGSVLLVLAVIAWRWRKDQLELDSAHLFQGVALVTVGLAAKLSGEALAITLAVESFLLFFGSKRRHGWLFELMGSVVAGWAFGRTLSVLIGHNVDCSDSLTHVFWHDLAIGGAVVALLFADAILLKIRHGGWRSLIFSWRAAYLVTMGLWLIAQLIDGHVAEPWESSAFAIAALVSAASIYAVRLPELALLGQGFLVLALLSWPGRPIFMGQKHPWWNAAPLGACALVLAHWWQRQTFLPLKKGLSPTLQLLSALSLNLVLMVEILMNHSGANASIFCLCSATCVMLGYGFATRSWALASSGQMSNFIALLACSGVLAAIVGQETGSTIESDATTAWYAALLPVVVVMATFGMLAFAPAKRWHDQLTNNRLRPLAVAYWVIGWVFVVPWVFDYVPIQWRGMSFAGIAAALLFAGAWWQSQLAQTTGAVFAAISYLAFFVQIHTSPTVAEIIAILLPAFVVRMTPRIAAKAGRPAPLPDPLLLPILSAVVVFSVWLWATRWAGWNGYSRGLTIVWSGVALIVLAAGLLLRERIYRLGGFLMLGLAIGRVFAIDVWALETIHRIFSFLTLGVVLLLLGYFYNKYSEQIRKWL